jgi:hypothetical protein
VPAAASPDEISEILLERARRDPDVAGAAITGSRVSGSSGPHDNETGLEDARRALTS